MSNWLGFSLTPHLRIDEGFGRDEQQNQQQEGGGSVMPLRSDGSLCDIDPFRLLEYFMAPCFLLHISWLHVLFSIFHGSMFSCSM